jgi:hypothetical protein
MAGVQAIYKQIINPTGFNDMVTEDGDVNPERRLYLRQPPNGHMLPLGTVTEAAARAGPGNNQVIGFNGAILGNFGTPQINDNLFILIPRPRNGARPGPIGGRRARRSRKRVRRSNKKARRSRARRR